MLTQGWTNSFLGAQLFRRAKMGAQNQSVGVYDRDTTKNIGF